MKSYLLLLNLQKIWLRKCPVSDFTLRLLSETCRDLVEISVESGCTDDTLSDEGVVTMANSFRNLLVIDISWNLGMFLFQMIQNLFKS